MRLLEAYTPKQIRSCGRMLEALRGKRTPDELITFARSLNDPSIQHMVSRYRLYLPSPPSREATKDEILFAIGWQVLRVWLKMSKFFTEKKVSHEEIKSFVSSERKKDLENSRFGWRKK